MTVLAASDLDGTLIFSARSARVSPGELAGLRCVERVDGTAAGFMTARAADRLTGLAERAVFVPVTTRTRAQFARVALPAASRFAVAANGGVLLVDGAVDRGWTATVVRRLAQAHPLDAVWRHAARTCRPEWTTKLRNGDGLYCYAVVRRSLLPAGFFAEQAAWAQPRGWRVSLQGRKLYWVPQELTKGAAVAEVARRAATGTLLAAGDSLLDLELLAAADRGIHPRHGELADTGWTAPHVSMTAGVGALAGEQIVDWFSAAVAG
jgi:hypothetical protein